MSLCSLIQSEREIGRDEHTSEAIKSPVNSVKSSRIKYTLLFSHFPRNYFFAMCVFFMVAAAL